MARPKKRSKVGAADEFVIDIVDASRPQPEIVLALRKAYRGAGILAIGIGKRRLEKKGRHTAQTTLKILLRKKKRPEDLRAQDKRLPRQIIVRLLVLGKRLRIRMPVDVEQAHSAVAIEHAVKPLPHGIETVGAFAVWTEAGSRRYGVVTAGHGLWADSADPAPVVGSMIHVDGQAPIPVVTRYASHMTRDGVDVALLETPFSSDAEFAAHFASMFKRIDVPTPSVLEATLGSPDDPRSLGATFLAPNFEPAGLRAVAFWWWYRVSVAGWGLVDFREAVESEGEPSTFIGGRSGSGIVTERLPSNRRAALHLINIVIDPEPLGTASRGLGSSFDTARTHLRARPGLSSLDLFWDVAAIP